MNEYDYYQKKSDVTCIICNGEFQVAETFDQVGRCPPRELIAKHTLVY